MDLINNPMTAEDKKAFFEEYYKIDDDDHEAIMAMVKKFPADPALALAVKDVFGIEYLEGYNLAEAIAIYGEERFKS